VNGRQETEFVFFSLVAVAQWRWLALMNLFGERLFLIFFFFFF